MTIRVLPVDSHGNYVRLENDPNAPSSFEFPRVTDALNFARKHQGKTGWFDDGSGELKRTTIRTYRASEDRQDISADFTNSLFRPRGY